MDKSEMKDLVRQNIKDISCGNLGWRDADDLNDLADRCEQRMDEMGFSKKDFKSPLERLAALHHALSNDDE